MRSVVYTHIRLDNNQVFYVGIGTKKRAYAKESRNKYWYNVVNKHGYRVNITHEGLCWEEACAIEKYLIAFYGRADLKAGVLVNMTDGGDGTPNLSEESKRKISESAKGRTGEKNANYGRKLSAETKELIRKANLGPNNPRYGKVGTMTGRFGELNPNYGRSHSEEVKMFISQNNKGRFKGDKNPMYNKSHSDEARKKISDKAKERYLKYGSHKTKMVLDTVTGFVYSSVKDVAKEFGVGVTTVRSWLNGWNKNPTSLKYLN